MRSVRRWVPTCLGGWQRGDTGSREAGGSLVFGRCTGMMLGRERAPPTPLVSMADRGARGHFACAAALPKADNALIVFKSDSFHLEDKIRKST